MKYLAVLGRQPKLSAVELEALFGEVRMVGRGLAEFETEVEPNIARLGGSLKLARELKEPLEEFLLDLAPGRKLIIGVSDYTIGARKADAQREGLRLKKALVRTGRSVRILSNTEVVLSTATVYHNHLGRKEGHVELLRLGRKWYVGIGVQDIEAYARRDQARPARDARVGMLPPKLAQILINLCGPLPEGVRVLDPFCGTGVLLQEAMLMGYKPYGSDLSEKMVQYSRRNLKWLVERMNRSGGSRDGRQAGVGLISEGVREDRSEHHADNTDSSLTFDTKCDIMRGDACTVRWEGQIDAVACETYLGQPMSVPPTEIKLREEKQKCGEIILGFLRNILPQIKSGTPLSIAVPAWLRVAGGGGEMVEGERNGRDGWGGQGGQVYSRLNILDEINQMGYNVIKFRSARQSDLLYYREGQVVAREIIVLRKR